MAKRAPKRDAAHRVTLAFEDNARLVGLFGANDRHLARIEKALDVLIGARGNEVTVEGTVEGCRLARLVLEHLYRRLELGAPVDVSEVDGAIRLAVGRRAGGPALRVAEELGELLRTPKRVVAARSPNQHLYMDAMRTNELVFGMGPAGTGKTFLAVAYAVTLYRSGAVDRIVLSRPAVEAGERLGFLPGDLREKVDPYLRPLYDALGDTLGGEETRRKIAEDEIEIAPLAFMRGRTLSNAFVILDEAQNATPMQMKMFLTRLGENSRMVVTGDPTQSDLPDGSVSGLADALAILRGVEGVGVVEFCEEDVVRHPLVTRIVKAYSAREAAGARGARARAREAKPPVGSRRTSREREA
ncbi:MAG: PhoH family protein [Alphaproteobacteria bacterium]|nr:PhoH family protein [Alphaproteobacteria bacterium]